MPNHVKVADYIADFLAAHSIKHVFSVTGGGAMHLNDALGKHKSLQCIYNNHEQACAIAAESYARICGKIAAVCVTTGPGGTNAITGVMGAYVDSIPMLVISGQVRFDCTVYSTDVPLRQLGDQEWDITKTVKNLTKYVCFVTDPTTIRYHLEKALYIATHGRPGPCWIDIPLNVQSAVIDPDRLAGYDEDEDASQLPPALDSDIVTTVLEKIKFSARPCIIVGSGIRISGSRDLFLSLAERLCIPVVTAWNAHDVIPDAHPLYAGRPGTLGTRGGNFVVHNCDLLIILGCRLNIRQIGYNRGKFAENSYKIMVDIDAAEMDKPTLNIDCKIHADVKDFIIRMLDATEQYSSSVNSEWLQYCKNINAKYPVVLPEYYSRENDVNPYVFFNKLFEKLAEDELVVSSNGSACVCSFQSAVIKSQTRLYTNSGSAHMGYGLPAAIGAAVCSGRRIICIEGDGSLQMNLQELQTLRYHRLPIKLIVLNNGGYHSIRQTQDAFFGRPLVGADLESGVGFIPFKKLADAFDLVYFKASCHKELEETITAFLSNDEPALMEVILDIEQPFAPKLASKMLEDRTMYSPPLYDMAPFLSDSEIKENLIAEQI